MKIEQKQPEFQPITVTIETQDELDQLAAMAYRCNFDNTVEGDDISGKLYRHLYKRVVTKYRGVNSDVICLEITE